MAMTEAMKAKIVTDSIFPGCFSSMVISCRVARSVASTLGVTAWPLLISGGGGAVGGLLASAGVTAVALTGLGAVGEPILRCRGPSESGLPACCGCKVVVWLLAVVSVLLVCGLRFCRRVAPCGMLVDVACRVRG